MKTPDGVLDVLRQSLEQGHAVEIEGLGTFRRTTDQRYEFDPQSRPQVFVAYVVEDLEPARRLCRALKAAGCAPWLDKERLLAGQNWPRAIARAIADSDVFIACFSPRSIVKRGQFQSELRYALDCARREPLDSTFVIPVRFEKCVVPPRIADDLQYVDLFPDWERGLRRVIQAVRRTAKTHPRVAVRLG